jgi:hypothetical protein
LVAFTDILAGRLHLITGIVPLAEVQPGVEQVEFPYRGVSDLGVLAGIESVRSVIGTGTALARVPLPQVRELVTRRTDAETLRNLPNLECLSLSEPVDVEAVPAGLRMLHVGCETFGGLEGLVRFERLERLRVGAAFVGSVEPLGRLTSLRWLSLDAGKGLRGLGHLTDLEELRLGLVGVSPANLKALSKLAVLRRLTLEGPVKSLEGIQGMQRLEYLFLTSRSLVDLAPLAGLPALAEVRIEQPRKLQDPSALGALPALRHLRYRAGTMTRLGTIPTIGFLRDHPRLEVLELIHTAVADGDLQPLETLPRLQFAGFAGEYAHVPELQARIGWDRGGPAPPYRLLKTGQWSILRDVAPLLDVDDNFDAEERVRAAIDPAIAKRLIFDSEPDMLGIVATSEADIRAAAAAIEALTV